MDGYTQEVQFPLVAPDGRALGTLALRAPGTHKAEVLALDGIQFTNVQTVRKPTATSGIEHYAGDPSSGLCAVMLLEETNYNVRCDAPGSRVTGMFPGLGEAAFVPGLFDDDDSVRTGVLNFRSHVGRAYLQVEVDGVCAQPVPVEVRSRKVGYADEYFAMMGDLSQDCSALIHALQSPVHQRFTFSQRSRRTLYEDYLFLEYLFRGERLPLAYRQIARTPKSSLERRKERVPLGMADCIGPNDLGELLLHSAGMVRVQAPPRNWPRAAASHVPAFVQQTRAHETVNVPENQLVKHFLEQVEALAGEVARSAEARGDAPLIAERSRFFYDECAVMLSDRWLADVGPMRRPPQNSQTLHKKEGYRDIYQDWLMFEFAFRFSWKAIEDDIRSSQKRMHQLYEYWCFFRLVQALKQIAVCEGNADSLLLGFRDGWEITIRRGQRSSLSFMFHDDGEKVPVKLFYNRGFGGGGRGSYSLPFRPDYTLRIGAGRAVYCHFDAKYRSQKELSGFEFRARPDEAEGASDKLTGREDKYVSETHDSEAKRGFKDADIYKMHTYKDAIYETEGAYVLYPGDRTGVFFEQPGEGAPAIPSIGAFPLKPGEQGEHVKELAEFLRKVLKARPR